MNPTGIFKAVVENADRITSFVLLICITLVLGYVTYGLLTGKFASLSDYKRITEEHKKLTDSHKETHSILSEAKDELAEARAVYGAAMVRIEFLERDLRIKDAELTALRSRVTVLEAELTSYRMRERER